MASSTKYVEKYKPRPINQVKFKDEFFVQKKDIALLTQFKDKIEDMHQIHINLEKQTEEGQWLILEGDLEDRRNAKNYITAMCNPAERKKVQFPSSSCAELTDPKTLELIEKKTNAFIRPLKNIAQFEISGSEFAVILALSEIEELAGSALREGLEDNREDEEDCQEEGVITISPNAHKASEQLSSALRRALSANSDGVCSVDDYRHTKPAVQRVLVNCLRDDDVDDIDEDLLFLDGPTESSPKGSNLMLFFEDGTDSAKDEIGEEKTIQTSPGVTEKMTELNISKPTETPSLTKEQKYLHDFGLSVGFLESEVNEALKFVDEKTRPSDFLDMLNSLQKHDISHEGNSDDDVIILESEIIDLTSDKKAVVDESVESKSEDKMPLPGNTGAVANPDKTQNYPTTLPEGYKERLLRDFFTEDENCSVDELKRRNAERQKLLRQNFESQASTPNTRGATGKKQNAKGKKKRKKNKQQKQNTDDQGDKSEMHDKQFRIDSDQSKVNSNDEEQTCVLRVWNKDHEQVEPGGGQQNEEPFQTTPKCKQNNKRTFQPNWQQQIGGNSNQRQNSPGRQAGGQWPLPQGPVGRGNYRKPTQVVTPVNVPHAAYRKAEPQGNGKSASELRYIVIDGSNVAMTHGNGKFSCKGIKLCVDFFRQRGHEKITVFVPQWRQYKPSEDNPILDQNILYELKDEDILVFTPSRKIGRKLVAAYDDRFVLELAEAEDGIIVSNDQYRDLMTEKAGWRKLIEERLLMYSFVKDRFMPPNDPLGREGPCLDDFLRVFKEQAVHSRQWQGYIHQQQQQHQKHYPQAAGHRYFPQGQGYIQPGQGQYQEGQGFSEQDHGHFLQGQSTFAKVASQGLNCGQTYQKQTGAKYKTPVQNQVYPNQFDDIDGGPSLINQTKSHWKGRGSLKGKGFGVPRTEEETEDLFKELRTIFPEADQEDTLRNVLANHEQERDLMKLTNYVMSVLFT